MCKLLLSKVMRIFFYIYITYGLFRVYQALQLPPHISPQTFSLGHNATLSLNLSLSHPLISNSALRLKFLESHLVFQLVRSTAFLEALQNFNNASIFFFFGNIS